MDYTLRVKVTSEEQPVTAALIEAKAENLPLGHGLEQGELVQAHSGETLGTVITA